MLSIHLNNLLFYSYHGLFHEEKTIGNEFELNITVHQLEVKENITSLDDTINYVKIYELVAIRMKQPTLLLETLCQDICRIILYNFSLANSVQINIKKKHPPISQLQGSVAVSFEMKR
ncbi:MAG TPA: dihydroneopterin aldolase [Chitinophagaceae bacterium]|nr:dihydroneopterin aldolase [Chitinophagaceae bacterium]MCC6634279.1 dihydroneopterin aldolase [Chitinophagaceae bacterium]HMZ47044.1 dihydroneopterin aldolase [Chitinophagaceae bacterium]HNE93547.1 dihydroneopterin aldolase [Chitinophagaceae bacterium]HNJ57898.1 dihydroneopterin aldolase [Chitinophagaceae bacterium]